MAGQASNDLFSQAVDLFSQRVDEYAQGIANRLGQPMSGQELNKDQVLQRWNFSPVGDPAMADAQYHQMVAQGMPPGQALNQVYPFRQMLIAGPDLNSQIDVAKQIATWAAQASGGQPPEPNPNQSPLLQQQLLQQAAPQQTAGALPPSTAPSLGGGGPVAAPPTMPPPAPAPAPGAMPGIQTNPSLPIQPVPMASGGVVTQPTVALIGEAGPEAVVPLTDVTSGGYPGTAPAQQPGGIGQGPEDFVSSLTPYATQTEQNTGIDHNLLLAMAANETGWGRSQTAQQQNNLFSIQGDGSNGSRWATYTSPQESFDAFANLLQNDPRYAQAWANRANPSQFLNALKTAGYVVDEPHFPAQAWVNQVASIYSTLNSKSKLG